MRGLVLDPTARRADDITSPGPDAGLLGAAMLPYLEGPAATSQAGRHGLPYGSHPHLAQRTCEIWGTHLFLALSVGY